VTWIYIFPLWLFAPLVALAFCSTACLGLALTRRHLQRDERIPRNDVAGPLLSTIGALLAVMLSFMVVGVWQEFDVSAANVQREAGAIADVYHLAAFMPGPPRHRIQADVDRYIHQVIALDWPAMQRGGRSREAYDTLYRILDSIVTTTARTPSQVQAQSAAMHSIQTVIDARRRRFHDNGAGIPAVLWDTMLFMAAVTVMVAFSFRLDGVRAHYTMIVALAAVIAISFVLIAELDYPFRGDMSISSRDFTHEYNHLHGIRLNSGY